MKKTEDKKNKIDHENELQLAQLSEQVADLDTKLRTALADYQNLHKELEKQHELREAMIKKRVFNDLIDIFSDLYFAVEQLPEDQKSNENLVGILNIMAKYKDLLTNHGVTEISFDEGTEYDPEYAEVLGIVNHKELDNKIAQTIQPGFRIGDVLIKPARVMIYKKDSS